MSNPYYCIKFTEQPKLLNITIERPLLKFKDVPNIKPFSVDEVISIGNPKVVYDPNLKKYELSDKLRELFPEIKENNNIANAYTAQGTEKSFLIQFYKVPENFL